MYPNGVAHPARGFYALPTRGPRAAVAERYLDAMRNAANFSDALEPACHGAGRSLDRGRATHVDDALCRAATKGLRVVTPIDPDAPAIRRRPDSLEGYHHRLEEKAPYAYKPITPVVQTVAQTGVARNVARMRPLMTVKG